MLTKLNLVDKSNGNLCAQYNFPTRGGTPDPFLPLTSLTLLLALPLGKRVTKKCIIFLYASTLMLELLHTISSTFPFLSF